MYIQILDYIQDKDHRIRDLEDIFFLTSKSDISTPEKRDRLYQAYAKPYIENWPGDVFFACNLDNHKTMGYLIGCQDSAKATPLLSQFQKSSGVFADLFTKYPAHLHINIHPDFQGNGAGTFLILEYIIELKKFGVRGVHIVTSPDEKNVQFYLKHKFKHQVQREYNGKPLLFMGLAL